MAVGDLGPKINELGVDPFSAGGWFEVVNDHAVLIYTNSGSDIWIKVYPINAANQILAVSASLNADPGNALNVGAILFRLGSTNNFAVVYNDISGGVPAAFRRVFTFNVSADGMTITPINSVALASDVGSGEFYTDRSGNNFHVSGTIYAYMTQISATDMVVRTLNISDDGLAIAEVDNDYDGVGANFSGNFQHIVDDIYAAIRSDGVNPCYLRTYRITDAGAITNLNNYVITATTGVAPRIWTLYPDSSGTIVLLAYTEAGPTYRLRTWYIFSQGIIAGALSTNPLDTEDTFYTSSGASHSLMYAGSNVWVMGFKNAGSFPALTSFEVSRLGIFAAAIIDNQLLAGAVSGSVTIQRFRNSASPYVFVNDTPDLRIGMDIVESAWEITATAIGSGTIAPSGLVTVLSGNNQNFIFTPSPGWEVISVVVDGVSQPIAGNYQFNNVIEDHTITVTFGATETAQNNAYALSRLPIA